ncbi:MAG: helix-hairpin-helix domain-containing protein [Gaiella sp.]
MPGRRTITGISPAIASRLLAQLGTVAAVAAATPREFETIEGIGPARARTLNAGLSGTSRAAKSATAAQTSASLYLPGPR